MFSIRNYITVTLMSCLLLYPLCLAQLPSQQVITEHLLYACPVPDTINICGLDGWVRSGLIR